MSSFADSALAAWHLLISGDPLLVSIILRSLALSASACLLAFAVGAVLASWLAVARFPGRSGALVMVNTLLSFPSVVAGLLVYLLLSRSGPLGFLGWLYSFKAMLFAQTLLVLPIVIALVQQVVADADAAHGEQLRSLGAGPKLTGLLLAWNERGALMTVLLAAFGRAISEVGAVMIVGGNIDGFTRVMTTTIALETSKGDLPLAMGLGLVLLIVVLMLQALIALLRSPWSAWWAGARRLA